MGSPKSLGVRKNIYFLPFMGYDCKMNHNFLIRIFFSWYSSGKKYQPRNFPGSPVVKNLPCKAEDVGLIPAQGTKSPYASGPLSPLATSTGPEYHTRDNIESCNKTSCMLQQNPHVLQLRPDVAKQINKYFKEKSQDIQK